MGTVSILERYFNRYYRIFEVRLRRRGVLQKFVHLV